MWDYISEIDTKVKNAITLKAAGRRMIVIRVNFGCDAK